MICWGTLPDFACLTKVYDQIMQMSGMGLVPPLVWSGSGFPPGINVSSAEPAFHNAASVYGQPTIAGNYTGTIELTTGLGYTVTKDFPIAVLGLTNGLVADPSGTDGYAVTLDTAHYGTIYNYSLSAAGGQAPITFSVDPDMIPDWVTVSSAGLITGIPDCSDVGINFYFDVTMTDDLGRSCAQTVIIPVTCPDPPAVCVSNAGTLPTGKVGVAYSQTLLSTFGTAPRTFAVTGGTLPTGLTLHSSGLIDGTPTKAAKFNFTVSVTAGCAACDCSSAVQIIIYDTVTFDANGCCGICGDGGSFTAELVGVSTSNGSAASCFSAYQANPDWHGLPVYDGMSYTMNIQALTYFGIGPGTGQWSISQFNFTIPTGYTYSGGPFNTIGEGKTPGDPPTVFTVTFHKIP